MLTPAKRQALEVLAKLDRPVTPGAFAKLMWPNSPSWRHHSNAGTGVGIRQRAGAFLSQLEREGLACYTRNFGHITRYVISAGGLAALGREP